MSRYVFLNSAIDHNPRPRTLLFATDLHQTRMSSSPSLLTQSKLDPPPNLLSLNHDEDEIVEYPQIVLLGDSITQFSTLTFQAYLQTLYIRRLDVINRGFSGFTAPMGYKALQKFLPCSTIESLQPNIKLLTVFFGANDACVPGEAQHVDLPRYISAIRSIVQYPAFQNGQGRTEIVVITPPPVNEHQFARSLSGSFQRRAGTTSQYADAVLGMRALKGVYVLDFWSILMRKVGWIESMGRDCCCEHIPRSTDKGNVPLTDFQHIPGCCHCAAVLPGADCQLSDFLSDGLHLNKLGYDVLFDALVNLIRRELPHCAPENIPFALPEWRDALSWDTTLSLD